MNCSKCYKECSDDMKFCPYCGEPLVSNSSENINTEDTASKDNTAFGEAEASAYETQPQTEKNQVMYCEKCGEPLSPQTLYCPNCGFYLASTHRSDAKSKLAAGLLGIFLGTLGVHNFYLGYYTKAVIQLLLTVVGIPLCCLFVGFFMITAAGIWGLIEGILILAGQIPTDAQGVPLSD